FDLRSVPTGPCRRCRDPIVDLGDVGPEILDGQRRRILFIVTESAVRSHDLMVRRNQAGEDGGPAPPAPRPCSKIGRVRTRVSCVCTTARSRPQWSKSESPAESESHRMTSTPAPRRRLANIGPIDQLRAGRLWRRLPQLFIGLYLFGAAMAMLVTAGVGMMPWDVLHSRILRHVPLTFGTIVTLLSFVVLLIWIPLRQQPGIGTILNALLIGPSLDLTRLFLPQPEHLGWNIALMLGGVVLN